MSNGAPWSNQEFATALGMHAAGATFGEIGHALGRTERAVESKLQPAEQKRDYSHSGPRIPAAVLDDRDRRMAMERDTTSAFNGDPLPGYSALDRMRAQGRTI